jgi:hypothetical protein
MITDCPNMNIVFALFISYCLAMTYMFVLHNYDIIFKRTDLYKQGYKKGYNEKNRDNYIKMNKIVEHDYGFYGCGLATVHLGSTKEQKLAYAYVDGYEDRAHSDSVKNNKDTNTKIMKDVFGDQYELSR